VSAATVHADIRAGLRQSLLAISALPSQKQWEGRAFDIAKGTPFVSESVRPVSSDVRSLGIGGTIAHTINATFTLHYPANNGTTQIEAAAGALMQAMRPGTSVVYGTAKGIIQSAERGPLLQQPDWINCPVTITVVAHTVN
jgi:hypothetical protein